jgi:hypothetical protein
MRTEPVAHSGPFGPVQPVKVEPEFAEAETVAVWPELYVPAPLTVPEPEPAVFNNRVKVWPLTVSVVLLLMLPEVAVRVVVPGLRPAAKPLALIVATPVSLLVQITAITVPLTVNGVEG